MGFRQNLQWGSRVFAMGIPGSLFLAALAVAALAMLGLRRFHRAGKRTARACFESRAVIVIGCDGDIQATSRARRWLGLPARGALQLAHLSKINRGFNDILAKLQVSDATAETFLATVSGKTIRIKRRTRGLATILEMDQETESERLLNELKKELTEARDEASLLREALQSAGVAAWSRLPEKNAWVEQSASGIAPETQKELVNAVSAQGPKRIEPKGDEGGVYQVNVVEGRDDLVVARSISDLAETERLMGRLVSTMSETFAHLSVGLMIFDDRQRLTLFNPRIIELFDESAAYLAGRPRLESLLDRWRSDGKLPERLDYAPWKAAFFGESPSTSDDQSVGESVLEETWHLADGRSLRVHCRRPDNSGLAIVVEDATESFTLRRTSASERAIRSMTTELMTEGIAVIGPDGRFRMINQAFRDLWGLERDASITGQNLAEVLKGGVGSNIANDFWRDLRLTATSEIKRVGAGFATERKIRMEDGRIIQPRFTTMPDGSTLTVFSDVTAAETMATALQQRNEALEHADDMRSALVDQISHQLRTPLNSIYGFGQILAEERFGSLNAEQMEHVTAIVASASDLTDVIEEMADLISIGGVSDPPEVLDPTPLLRDVVSVVKTRFEARGMAVTLTVTDAPKKMTIERLRLRQVIFNALIDSLARTPQGETARVMTGHEDGALVITVDHPDTHATFDGGLAYSLAQRSALLCNGEIRTKETEGGHRKLVLRIPEAPLKIPPAYEAPQSAVGG